MNKSQLSQLIEPIYSFCSLTGLDIPDTPSPSYFFQHQGFLLLKDSKYLLEWANHPENGGRPPKFFGVINLMKFCDLPYFSFWFERKQMIQAFKELRYFTSYSTVQLESFIMSLWFVKDNSVNVDRHIAFDPSPALASNEMRAYINENTGLNWMADGYQRNLPFTKVELKKAEEFAFKIFALAPQHRKSAQDFLQSDPTTISSGVDTNPLYTTDYSAFNRIERAFQFLSHARASRLVVLKITFYMCIYESLFVTDEERISQTIAERCSNYIEVDIDYNFRLLKDCYGVRSRYVHGDILDKRIEKRYGSLNNLSIKLDDLTRKVFVKVINVDSNYFLQDKKLFKAWLLNYDNKKSWLKRFKRKLLDFINKHLR